jgi:DNA replication protein
METQEIKDLIKEKIANIQKNRTTQKDLKTGTDTFENAWTIPASEFRKQEARRYRDYSNWKKSDYERNFANADYKNKKEKEHSDSFKRFCKNFGAIKTKGLGIFMVGNAGTGKTYYCDCIMNELMEENKVYRTSLYQILEEMRQEYNKYKEATDDFVFTRLEKADLVIFDDLGNEYITDWGKEKMFLIFDFLYRNRISFIINTNLDDAQFKKFLQINGSVKLLDRIKERCKKYMFDWESRRAELHKKDFEELY